MRRKRVLQSILAAVVLFSSTSYAQHVNSDKPLNCDSTCIIPDSRTTPLPKAQIARSPTIISQGPSRAQCGSAHQSVLPGPPSSFLCAPGMASNVATINDDGDITYRWTCGTALGVASRTIIWSLIEQLRVSLMPLFHGLHRCFAVQC